MSDKAGNCGSSSSGDDKDRKGKQVMNVDNDQKDPEESPFPFSSVPSGLSADDLAVFHMFSESDGGMGLSELMKQQQQAFEYLKQINNPVQKSEASNLSQKETDYRALDTYFADSDTDKEELDSNEELIFELEISDRNRLIIPYALASDHFPPLILHPNTEETLQLFDPLRREWEMTLRYDGNSHSYIITHGWTLYLERYNLSSPDLIRFYKPVPQLQLNHFYIQHQKRFEKSLFEVCVPQSNRLSIPCYLAAPYIITSGPQAPPDHLHEYELHLTDNLNHTWEMRFICFKDEEAFIVIRGWEQYVAQYALKYPDTVRFFRQNPSPGQNSFIIHHELGSNFVSFLVDDPPLFLRGNLLCELDLSEADVAFGRLEMPGVEIPFEYHDKEMIKITDENSKNWYMIIVYPSVSREYMILDGWEGIVREYELEAGDMVRLYMPVHPDHDKHFLIECVKQKKNTEKDEGGCDSGIPVNGEELSDGGKNRGKEIAK